MFRIGVSLTTLIDGQKAWEQVCGELRRTLDDPLRGLPVLAGFAVVLLVIWANVRVARWIIAPAKHGAGSDHRGEG